MTPCSMQPPMKGFSATFAASFFFGWVLPTSGKFPPGPQARFLRPRDGKVAPGLTAADHLRHLSAIPLPSLHSLCLLCHLCIICHLSAIPLPSLHSPPSLHSLPSPSHPHVQRHRNSLPSVSLAKRQPSRINVTSKTLLFKEKALQF